MSEQRFQQIVEELQSLRQESIGTNKRLDGLFESFVVLQRGVGDVRRELQQMKEILAEKVV